MGINASHIKIITSIKSKLLSESYKMCPNKSAYGCLREANFVLIFRRGQLCICAIQIAFCISNPQIRCNSISITCATFNETTNKKTEIQNQNITKQKQQQRSSKRVVNGWYTRSCQQVATIPGPGMVLCLNGFCSNWIPVWTTLCLNSFHV